MGKGFGVCFAKDTEQPPVKTYEVPKGAPKDFDFEATTHEGGFNAPPQPMAEMNIKARGYSASGRGPERLAVAALGAKCDLHWVIMRPVGKPGK